MGEGAGGGGGCQDAGGLVGLYGCESAVRTGVGGDSICADASVDACSATGDSLLG